MRKNKSKTITGILIIMIFGLIGTIFYITNILITPDATKSKIAAKKSKAADITYSKDLALNGGQCSDDVQQCPDGSYVSRVPPDCQFAPCSNSNPGDTSPPTPTSTNVILPIIPTDTIPAPTSSSITKPTDVLPTRLAPTVITEPNPTPSISSNSNSDSSAPSPTERLLADNNSTSGSFETNAGSSTPEDIPTTTPISSLPRTGLVSNSIIIFGVSSLFLFLAFLY